MAARANSTPDIRLAGADPGPADGPFQGMGAKGWWTDYTATGGAGWRAFVGKSLEDADRSRVARTAYRRTLGLLSKNMIALPAAYNLDAVRVALDRAPVCVGGKPRTGAQSVGRVIGTYTEVPPLGACVRYPSPFENAFNG